MIQTWELLYCEYRDQCSILIFFNLEINLIFLSVSHMVIVPSQSVQGFQGALIRSGLSEMKRLSFDLQIKSAHTGYRLSSDRDKHNMRLVFVTKVPTSGCLDLKIRKLEFQVSNQLFFWNYKCFRVKFISMNVSGSRSSV